MEVNRIVAKSLDFDQLLQSKVVKIEILFRNVKMFVSSDHMIRA